MRITATHFSKVQFNTESNEHCMPWSIVYNDKLTLRTIFLVIQTL